VSRRLRPGELLAAAGGVVLLASMFLDWYGPVGRTDGVTAWQAFTVADVLIAIVALFAIALAVAQVALRGPALPVALGVITSAVTIAGVIVVVFRLIDQPGPNNLVELRAGAWIGLAGALAAAAGAWLAMGDERARPSDPLPLPIERRAAPPA
jgi:hypothetical protein